VIFLINLVLIIIKISLGLEGGKH